MRNRLILLLLLLLTAAAHAAEPPKSVALSLPLTGAFAEFGTAFQNGVLLAKRDFPERFSGVDLIIEDDAYDAKRSITNFYDFINHKKAEIIYQFGTETSYAVAPLAERAGVVLFVGSMETGVSKGCPHVVRAYPPYHKYGAAVRKRLKREGIVRAKLIVLDMSFFIGMSEHVKGDGLQIEPLSPVSRDEHNFDSFALRVKNETALGVYLSSGQTIELARKLSALHFRPKIIFGATQFYNRSLLESVNGFYEGAFFAHLFAKNEFESHYEQTFGNDTQIVYAAAAYEFALLIADLVKESRNNKIMPLEALKNVVGSGRESVVGFYKLNEEDGTYLDIPVSVYRVKNSRAVLVSD